MAVGSGEPMNRHGRVEPQRQNQAEFGFARGPITSAERTHTRRARRRAGARKRAASARLRVTDHAPLFVLVGTGREQPQRPTPTPSVGMVGHHRSESLAVVAHDVRGALSNIVGLAELLGEDAPADSRHLAERIVTLAHDVSIMMDELIEAGRTTPDEAEPTPTALSARALLAECAADAEVQCRRKGLAFHAALPDDETLAVDRIKLVRIIQNLLSNAVRYTLTGRVTLSAHFTPTTLSIAVQDTGIGIPPAEQEAAFTPYERLAPAAAMEPDGAGLGLASVRRLCALLGAEIQVHSSPGVGSTFVVSVPRGREPSDTQRGAVGSPVAAWA